MKNGICSDPDYLKRKFDIIKKVVEDIANGNYDFVFESDPEHIGIITYVQSKDGGLDWYVEKDGDIAYTIYSSGYNFPVEDEELDEFLDNIDPRKKFWKQKKNTLFSSKSPYFRLILS